VVRPDDSLPELEDKVRLATILGTFQSTLTTFRYLRKVWKDNAEEERLLGVSLTGIMDHPVLSDPSQAGDWLRRMKVVAQDANIEWAEKLGIPKSKQLTLVKPSGTVSQLCGTSSGIHPRFAPYYLRRVTQDNKDPLTELMIEQGIPHRKGAEKTTFSFPMSSPSSSICARNMGALQQLKLWKVYQQEWCDGNPSQTIYYTDSTFLEVQQWVYKEWDNVGGLSFFPYDDFVYDRELQPYLEVGQEEYEEALRNFPPEINWDGLSEYERDDQHITSSQELACAGGQCEL
jgi:ribonucleoside-diphosphate reductase alpha chain